MTDAQKRFCDEYLIDLNATRAYKVAYKRCKKDETARANSSRLLTNDNVKKYIAVKQEEIEKRTKITQDRVLKELAKIAFGDIRKLYTDNGALRSIVDLEDDIAGAISGVETYEEYEGRGEDREHVGDTKKVKMLDKTKALELIGKHLGMFKDTNININTNYEEYLKRVERR